MRISYDQTFQTPLADIGAELVRMIKDRDYILIAERFGYAKAFDRPLAEAIATDIDFCHIEEGRTAVISLANEARILVKYFKQPNSSNLFGLVECFLPLEQDAGELLAELIITIKDQEFYVCLEDVSYIA
ncbi:hypothetical protein [Undibacterium fentianense]|uniref:Uncharacterized protein n=1 Tax=Undibacterium fentianense TaxID=2828728 RepID=A0A941E7H4_9BURK|nr:hypothetical protein [Undibacterium fentianense]MBR7800108.1 hypothetical protein [Undibacterium fentianense]